jgi:hypothetical protein
MVEVGSGMWKGKKSKQTHNLLFIHRDRGKVCIKMGMLFDTAIVESIERHFVLFCVLVLLVFVNKVVLECTTSTSVEEVFIFNCGW